MDQFELLLKAGFEIIGVCSEDDCAGKTSPKRNLLVHLHFYHQQILHSNFFVLRYF